MEFEGTILRGRSLDPIDGRVVVEDGTIVAVESASVRTDRIILPAFVNAHTHIGDTIAKETGIELPLEELVAPPDGLKHRLLRAASRDESIEAMRSTARTMIDTGTGAFADFREGGPDGVSALREAVAGLPIRTLAMGRGTTAVLETADGYGASGAADADFSSERRAADAAGRPFAIHAGENGPADIDPALDLDPDVLVHMVHATSEHLERVAVADVPVVVCPRANLVTGVGLPPLRELLERTMVGLGTDNVMLNAPSMFREMEFASKLFDVTAVEVLRMATVAGADIFDLNCGVIEPGYDARLLVLDADSDNLRYVDDPVRGVVRRAATSDIVDVVLPSV